MTTRSPAKRTFEYRGKELAALLSSPLVAIARANEKMATEQLRLLMDVCFYKRDHVYSPVMITMTIQRMVVQPHGADERASLAPVITEFQVPLITLLPINSLAVEGFEFSFDMEVQSQFDVEDAPNLASAGSHQQRVASKLVGRIRDTPVVDSSTEQDRGESSGVSVNASVGTLPLPVGVTTLIQAFAKAITPSTLQKGSSEP